VKAGGMRVARPRQASGSESKEKNEMTKEEIEEYGSRCVHRVNIKQCEKMVQFE